VSLDQLVGSATALQMMGYELYELEESQMMAAKNGRVLTLNTAQNQVFVTVQGQLRALYSRIGKTNEFKCLKNNLG
jgi:hypothetical protein